MGLMNEFKDYERECENKKVEIDYCKHCYDKGIADKIPEAKKILQGIINNSDTGYLYMGQMQGAGIGERIRNEVRKVLELLS